MKALKVLVVDSHGNLVEKQEYQPKKVPVIRGTRKKSSSEKSQDFKKSVRKKVT
jgi:hypothetical protein